MAVTFDKMARVLAEELPSNLAYYVRGLGFGVVTRSWDVERLSNSLRYS